MYKLQYFPLVGAIFPLVEGGGPSLCIPIGGLIIGTIVGKSDKVCPLPKCFSNYTKAQAEACAWMVNLPVLPRKK